MRAHKFSITITRPFFQPEPEAAVEAPSSPPSAKKRKNASSSSSSKTNKGKKSNKKAKKDKKRTKKKIAVGSDEESEMEEGCMDDPFASDPEDVQ